MNQTHYHCTTGQAPNERKMQFWIDEVCAHVSQLEIASDAGQEFRGEFWRRELGPVALIGIQASHQRGVRRVSQSRSVERCDLLYARRGEMKLRQGSRTVNWSAGQMIIFDQAEKYEFDTTPDMDCVLLACPPTWLRSWLPDPEACMMQVLDQRMLWVRSLTLAMSNLFESIDDHRLPEGLVLDQVGGCLALACHGLERDATRYRIGFAKDIVQTLRTNLGNPDLSPADVAAQHRISKRYLHAIFASLGTTFGRELLAIRLARAEALLRDDRYRRSSIGEIATLCGFSDPAHFARRFRQSRGQSPALFRQFSGR